MSSNQILSLLGKDKSGVFPSQEYFKEKRATSPETLILLEFFIQTNQIKKELILSIFNKLKEFGWKSLSYRQINLLLTTEYLLNKNYLKAEKCK